MLSRADFVRQSLETHLFFARIMKEHAFFLEVAFTPRDEKFKQRADMLRMEFDDFLEHVISLSDGVINNEVLKSGEIVTKYTLAAEKATEFYTGVKLATELTKAEEELCGNRGSISPNLERKVFALNRRGLKIIDEIIRFKNNILNDVLECKMFTLNYPLLIEHIMREAKLYFSLIKRLQYKEVINVRKDAFEQEAFWNRIMAEHSKFIRGLLDPTEEELIETAHNFGKEFDMLTCEAREAMEMATPSYRDVTRESFDATMSLRDFKATATEGLLECKIKSIIVPLLGDHVLREANQYLNLLRIFEKC
ncbi:MAG TPA: DUF2935 domain-containing protein [Clostridiales bacterium]|nr:DUF2935 domain-containing protein [Clostridiales bacterium]